MIVINYRRGDVGGYALYVHAELSRIFGKASVFLDVGGELTGVGDYTKAIFDKVERCRLLICLIGPAWLTIADAAGPRLHNPDDLVRREIDLALQRNKIVLPVLMNGARMPDRHSLPACISEIVKYNAVSFRHERFEADTIDLIRATRQALASRAVSPSPVSPTKPTICSPQSLDGLEGLTNALAVARKYNPPALPNALFSGAYSVTNDGSDCSLLDPFSKDGLASNPSLWDIISKNR